MSLKIKGSGNKYYTVDLENETCTCKDFTCRKHHYSIGDPRRQCKHIREAIELSENIETNYYYNSKPRESLNKLVDYINEVLSSNNDIIRYNICGDWRRGLDYISELNVSLRVLNSESLVLPFESSIINLVENRGSFMKYELTNGLNMNIHVVDNSSYPFKVLFLTGSNEFLVMMKSVALKKNLLLTDEGFMNNSEVVEFDIGNESEIFEYLGMDYISPKERK